MSWNRNRLLNRKQCDRGRHEMEHDRRSTRWDDGQIELSIIQPTRMPKRRLEGNHLPTITGVIDRRRRPFEGRAIRSCMSSDQVRTAESASRRYADRRHGRQQRASSVRRGQEIFLKHFRDEAVGLAPLKILGNGHADPVDHRLPNVADHHVLLDEVSLVFNPQPGAAAENHR